MLHGTDADFRVSPFFSHRSVNCYQCVKKFCQDGLGAEGRQEILKIMDPAENALNCWGYRSIVWPSYGLTEKLAP